MTSCEIMGSTPKMRKQKSAQGRNTAMADGPEEEEEAGGPEEGSSSSLYCLYRGGERCVELERRDPPLSLPPCCS